MKLLAILTALLLPNLAYAHHIVTPGDPLPPPAFMMQPRVMLCSTQESLLWELERPSQPISREECKSQMVVGTRVALEWVRIYTKDAKKLSVDVLTGKVVNKDNETIGYVYLDVWVNQEEEST